MPPPANPGDARRGSTANEIAAKLELSKPTVYAHLRQLDSRKNSAPATLDSVAAKRKELEVQLEGLRRQEAALIEAARLKLINTPVGILISKSGQHMELSETDARELQAELAKYLVETL
jgi:hypothetical protein